MSAWAIACWCIVGANSVLALATRGFHRRWWWVDVYLLGVAMYALATNPS